MTTEHETSQLDHVTSRRLAQLANRPVDTARLESQLHTYLTGQQAPAGNAASSRTLLFPWWASAALGAAAVIILVVTIGWIVFQNPSTRAVAAPTDLAQIHFDITRGLAPHLTVSTVDEANRLLAEQSSGARLMPENLPGQIMSCCLHQYAGTMLSCVLIEQNGQLVTVALADGAKMHSPKDGDSTQHSGREFVVHHANGITMVMAHENGRWLCVMGEASREMLIEIAAGIRM